MLYSGRPAGPPPRLRYCVLSSEVAELSPILVRPVREQLEHDRVIRLLQAKYKRKFEVAINPGNEQTMPVGTGTSAWYPDLVLQTSDKSHKLAGVVEVETAESVNNLEAMSQWATFARFRVPFHLYLPTASVDSARRFCADLSIPVAEMWAYQTVGDQLRFTLIQRTGPAVDGKSRSATADLGDEPRPKPAAPRAKAAAPAAAPSRPQAASRTRTSRPAPRRSAARRPPAASSRRPALKAKAARPVGKAPARRKAKAAPSRAQKRR
jgi:hypothetical protein